MQSKSSWALILGAGTRDGADATLFDKILEGKIPATVVYEDALCLAFRDISPVAPTHVILIPKRRDGLTQLQFATAEHKQVLGHMLAVAVPAIAAKEGLNSYRLVVNDGAEACQSVFHLHMHIIGGKKLSWPPGA
ncbi:HIT-like domain-containing protein [Pavlovales sp. CCMP2436]|nr:HIT-like domain-containing protein [Pavlovales sp. CCMP2436]